MERTTKLERTTFKLDNASSINLTYNYDPLEAEQRIDKPDNTIFFINQNLSNIYIKTIINDKTILAMIDTGSVKNCMSYNTYISLALNTQLEDCNEKFIKNFSDLAKPLTDCLKQDKVIQTDEVKASFLKLKEALATPPILAWPDINKEFLLYCDASNHAIGAILCQDNDGTEKPIAYGSISWMPTIYHIRQWTSIYQ